MPDPMRSKYSSRQRKRGNIEELDKQLQDEAQRFSK